MREFSDRPVEKDLVKMVVEAARYAPSGQNSQSSYFVVVTGDALEKLRVEVRDFFRELKIDPEMPEIYHQYKRWAQENGWSFFYGAPVILIVANRKEYRNAVADSAAATMTAMLAAESVGLDTGWLTILAGVSRQKKIRKILDRLGVPEDYEVITSMTMGYGKSKAQATARTSEVRWVEKIF